MFNLISLCMCVSIFQINDHCKLKGLGKDIIENKKTVEYILKIPHYM